MRLGVRVLPGVWASGRLPTSSRRTASRRMLTPAQAAEQRRQKRRSEYGAAFMFWIILTVVHPILGLVLAAVALGVWLWCKHRERVRQAAEAGAQAGATMADYMAARNRYRDAYNRAFLTPEDKAWLEHQDRLAGL